MHFKPKSAVDTIEILLVDDHPALRTGLRSLLTVEPDMRVVGDVASGEDAYLWYRSHRPDVVVMDLSMAGFGGMESLLRIRKYDADARILVYSVHSSVLMLNRALAIGALGYVTKASEIEVLVRGLREVSQGRGYVSPDMVAAMVETHAAQMRPLLESLGDREFQIFLLTAQGNLAETCAQALNLSVKTVRNHLTQIKAKLRVANTADLTRVAIRAGIVDP